MIEADRVDHSRAKLDHDLIVPITDFDTGVFLVYSESMLFLCYSPALPFVSSFVSSPGVLVIHSPIVVFLAFIIVFLLSLSYGFLVSNL